MNVAPAPPLRHSINRLADRLASSAAGFVDGAVLLEGTKLEGDDWRRAFDAAIKQAGAVWQDPWDGIAHAKVAVGKLIDHESAAAARDSVAGAAQVTKRTFDSLGRGFMQLPPDLTMEEGREVLDLSARLIRRMSAGIDDASAALRQLGRTPVA